MTTTGEGEEFGMNVSRMDGYLLMMVFPVRTRVRLSATAYQVSIGVSASALTPIPCKAVDRC
jgi:hypothetical protein